MHPDVLCRKGTILKIPEIKWKNDRSAIKVSHADVLLLLLLFNIFECQQ